MVFLWKTGELWFRSMYNLYRYSCQIWGRVVQWPGNEVAVLKDIPIFTTDFGVASLILREIPYQAVAYVRLQDCTDPVKTVEACVAFCRMLGAERVFATGQEALERWPLHTAVLRMACAAESLADTDAALWPLLPEQAAEFQQLYNEKIAHMPNAAWMTDADMKKTVESGEGYFVHRGGELLGLGIVSGEWIRFVASLRPGAGADVVRALAHAAVGDRLLLETATANTKAVALYQRLGFVTVREQSRWYTVFEKDRTV